MWSGKIVLQNLELNRASIQKLNLPVSVANGSVKRVEVIIPWTSLESQPVRIDMSGVFLQVGPVVVSNLDPADVSARALENKRHKIEALEKLALPDDEDKSSGGRTYLQRLTAKIIGMSFHVLLLNSPVMPHLYMQITWRFVYTTCTFDMKMPRLFLVKCSALV